MNKAEETIKRIESVFAFLKKKGIDQTDQVCKKCEYIPSVQGITKAMITCDMTEGHEFITIKKFGVDNGIQAHKLSLQESSDVFEHFNV